MIHYYFTGQVDCNACGDGSNQYAITTSTSDLRSIIKEHAIDDDGYADHVDFMLCAGCEELYQAGKEVTVKTHMRIKDKDRPGKYLFERKVVQLGKMPRYYYSKGGE